MNKEKWSDIEGYEGYYKISNYGVVKSIERALDNGVVYLQLGIS